MTPRRVTIVEVGPRDGLQNEKAAISTADKIAFVNRLSLARLPVVEVTAFVSPKWVPQMADAADVLAGIERAAGTRYTALVPNLAGLERARIVEIDGQLGQPAAQERPEGRAARWRRAEIAQGQRLVVERHHQLHEIGVWLARHVGNHVRDPDVEDARPHPQPCVDGWLGEVRQRERPLGTGHGAASPEAPGRRTAVPPLTT